MSLLLVGLLVGCAPLVRPATFVGARDQVTDATLLGPFDGQVVDVATGEPVAEAMVVGVWAFILLWSKPWLDRFHYGPFEWAWRSLVQWKPQRFVRS